MSLLLLFVPIILFWKVWTQGEVLLPADIAFENDPLWVSLAPTGFVRAENPVLGDQIHQVYPWKVFVRRALSQGYLPLWNPYTNCGEPFVGNGQSALFSPFNLLELIFPLHWGLVISASLRLLIAGIGTFMCAREHGISTQGAVLAMVTFTLSGPMLIWVNYPLASVIVWLPLLFWLTSRYLEKRTSAWALALIGIIGMQFLGGHPETSFQVLFVWAFYVLYRILFLPHTWKDKLNWGLHFGLFVLGGIALAAIQLLPFVEAFWHSAALQSARPSALQSISSVLQRVVFTWEAWPTAVLTLMPNFFGTPHSDSYWYPFGGNYVENILYAGILPLLLAVTAIWQSLKTLKHQHAISHRLYFSTLGILSLGMALRLPLFNAINQLPIFNIAAPQRMRVPYVFSVALLAGFGLDHVPVNTKQRKILHRCIILAGLGNIIMVAIVYIGLHAFKHELIQSGRAFMLQNQETPYLWRTLKYYYELVETRYYAKLQLYTLSNWKMYLPAIITGTYFLFTRVLSPAGQYTRNYFLVILGITLFDLVALGTPLNPTITPEHVFPLPPALAYLQQDADLYRVIATDTTLDPNSALLFAISDVRGYDATTPRRYVDLLNQFDGHYRDHFRSLFTTVNDTRLDMLNVKYALTTQTLDGKWQLVYQDEGYIKLYRNPNALPRAYVVYQADIIPDSDTARQKVLAAEFDFRHTVVLETKPADWPPSTSPPDTQATTPSITKYTSRQIKINVEMQHPGILVLTDTFTPGWQAYLNGSPIPIYRANYAFRALVLPAGSHTVLFEYESLSFRIGMLTSVATLVGSLLILYITQQRNTRGRR